MERRGPLKDHCPVLPGQAGGALSRCSWLGVTMPLATLNAHLPSRLCGAENPRTEGR